MSSAYQPFVAPEEELRAKMAAIYELAARVKQMLNAHPKVELDLFALASIEVNLREQLTFCGFSDHSWPAVRYQCIHSGAVIFGGLDPLVADNQIYLGQSAKTSEKLYYLCVPTSFSYLLPYFFSSLGDGPAMYPAANRQWDKEWYPQIILKYDQNNTGER